jgi:hypothetical protein
MMMDPRPDPPSLVVMHSEAVQRWIEKRPLAHDLEAIQL